MRKAAYDEGSDASYDDSDSGEGGESEASGDEAGLYLKLPAAA